MAITGQSVRIKGFQARHFEKRVPHTADEAVVEESRARFPRQPMPTLYGEKLVLRILDAAGIKIGIGAGDENGQKQRS